MNFSQILEKTEAQSEQLIQIAQSFAELSKKLQKENEALKKELKTSQARVAELEEILRTDGCLCGNYEKLYKEFSELEEKYIEILPYAPEDL
jgi:predicted nuclease with TOPRIM domain